ncbi:hypothetical protein ACWKWU_00385 [Chitinophaga lutea]
MQRYLWSFLLLLSLPAFAQVSMTVQLPPAGVMLKSQLWQVTLLSASDRPVAARVSLRLLDAQSRQPVMSALTAEMWLNKGVTALGSNRSLVAEYEYFTQTIDRAMNGLLPAGNYIACYSLIVNDKFGNQPGEDCVPFAVEPLSPPMLNYPAHQSVVETTNPQFSWLPPAPLKLFSQLQYEFILTEVHPGQSPESAVQQNIPVYRAVRLKNNFLNYPVSATQLDTSKLYAWTILARNQDLFAAQAETWSFRFKGHGRQTPQSNGMRVQLKRELDGTVVDCRESLVVGYEHEAADSTVQCEVLDLAQGNRVVYQQRMPVKRGSNELVVPLGRKGKWEYGKLYLFRLLNGRGEYWQVKFIRNKA